MIEDVRRRTACDRCHSQKLRCPKRPGADICERCFKAKKACSYSPFRQKKPDGSSLKTSTESSNVQFNSVLNGDSPSGVPELPALDTPQQLCETSPSSDDSSPSESQQPNILCTNDPGFDFDFSPSGGFVAGADFDDLDLGTQSSFPCFNFDPMSPIMPDLDSSKNNLPFLGRHPATPHDPQPSSMASIQLSTGSRQTPESIISVTIPLAVNWKLREETVPLDSISKCVARLSTLSVDLLKLRRTLPFITVTDLDSQLNQWNNDGFPPKEFRLDETFRVIQEMIDLYPSILTVAQQSQPTHEQLHRSNRPRDTIDHSTILLGLSCHLRLIDLFETLLLNMNHCVQARAAGFDVKTPPTQYLQIGSYIPPASSAIPMQTLLIVHLCTQLSSYAEQLVVEVRKSELDERMIEDLSSDATKNMYLLSLGAAENVSRKAHGIVNTLSTLRNEMLSQGLVV